VSPSRRWIGRALAGVRLAGLVLTATLLASAVSAGPMPAAAAPAAAAAETGYPSQTQQLTQLAEGTGRDVTVGRCIICHSLEYIPSNAPAMNRAGWEKTIQKMRDRFGAPITDEEARQILDYLAAHYSGKP
jgi:cytochrome c5